MGPGQVKCVKNRSQGGFAELGIRPVCFVYPAAQTGIWMHRGGKKHGERFLVATCTGTNGLSGPKWTSEGEGMHAEGSCPSLRLVALHWREVAQHPHVKGMPQGFLLQGEPVSALIHVSTESHADSAHPALAGFRPPSSKCGGVLARAGSHHRIARYLRIQVAEALHIARPGNGFCGAINLSKLRGFKEIDRNLRFKLTVAAWPPAAAQMSHFSLRWRSYH